MNGRIEIEIGGKKRLLKFGTNQTALFCDLTGRTLSEALNFKTFKAGDLREMIFSGLSEGCRMNKEKPDFDSLTVGDWMDDVNVDDMKNVINAVTGQMPKEEEKKREAEIISPQPQ